jgi:acyl-CoA thioester hydrolase
MEYVIVSRNEDQEDIRTIGKTKQVVIDYSTKKPTAIPTAYKEKMIAIDNPEV